MNQLDIGPGSMIADVPVPQGFRLDEQRSMNRSYQTVRWLDHYYDGKQDLMAVRNFYMAQLPAQKWEITADTLTEGAYTIKCKKGVERCDITINKQKKDGLWSSVRIHIVLEPQQAPTGNGALTQEPRPSGQSPDEP